jgi:large subunit ribosomal protein L7/L12
MALDTANIIEQLKGASILELNDLVHAIEEEFGVTAAAPVATAGVVVVLKKLSQASTLN